MMEIYTNIKSGRKYVVVNKNIINATNANDGQIMVLYYGEKLDGSGVNTFVREINEFNEKFKKSE